MHLLGFLRFMVILVNDLATVDAIASDSEKRYVRPACAATEGPPNDCDTGGLGGVATVTSAR